MGLLVDSLQQKSKMKLKEVMKFIRRPFGVKIRRLLSSISEFFIDDYIIISTFGRILSNKGCLLSY